MVKGLVVPKGLRRLISADPAQRILDQIEMVQHKANFKVLRQVLAVSHSRIRRGWIHVTDATVPCDRLLAGALLGISPPRRPVSPDTRRIFDNGTYTHLRYQVYFRCLPAPFKVEAPHLLRYWPLVGEADIDLQHPEIGDWIIELKTLNSSQWKSLTSPFAFHEDQLNCYQALRGGWAGQMWYENKDNQDLKLYTRDFDRKAWAKIWERANQAAWDLMAGRMPPMCDSCADPAFCEDKIVVTEAALEKLDAERRTHSRG